MGVGVLDVDPAQAGLGLAVPDLAVLLAAAAVAWLAAVACASSWRLAAAGLVAGDAP